MLRIPRYLVLVLSPVLFIVTFIDHIMAHGMLTGLGLTVGLLIIHEEIDWQRKTLAAVVIGGIIQVGILHPAALATEAAVIFVLALFLTEDKMKVDVIKE